MTNEKLQQRVVLYEELAYYEARANKALKEGKMDAHIVWARKWHDLKKLLDS